MSSSEVMWAEYQDGSDFSTKYQYKELGSKQFLYRTLSDRVSPARFEFFF